MSTTWLFLICYKNERVRGDYKSCLICTHCSSVCVPVVAFYTGLITQHWRFSSRASCANGDNQYQSPLQVLLVLQNCTAVKSNDRHDEKQDARGTTIDQLAIHEIFYFVSMQNILPSSTSKASQWSTGVGVALIGQMSPKLNENKPKK